MITVLATIAALTIGCAIGLVGGAHLFAGCVRLSPLPWLWDHPCPRSTPPYPRPSWTSCRPRPWRPQSGIRCSPDADRAHCSHTGRAAAAQPRHCRPGPHPHRPSTAIYEPRGTRHEPTTGRGRCSRRLRRRDLLVLSSRESAFGREKHHQVAVLLLRSRQAFLELAHLRLQLIDLSIPWIDARRTAATMLLVLEVPTRAVMQVMGSSQTAMTARYQHVPGRGVPEHRDPAGVLVPA